MSTEARKPDYERNGVRLYCGDCLEILPTLEAGSVDAVVTDPPYGVGIADWDHSVPHYLCAEFHRITSGAIVWFGSASQHHNDLAAFTPCPQRVCVWTPGFTLSKTMSQGMAYRWHPVYCWQLPADHDGPTWDVWRHNCDGHNEWNHPATKPIGLITDCCGFCCNYGTILDPFMGSGTTGVACIRTRRKFVGIEIDRHYFDIAVKRIEAEFDRHPLFAEEEQAAQQRGLFDD